MEMNDMKIVRRDRIAGSKFLEFFDFKYEDKTGMVKSWFCANRPGNRKAVIIVPIVKEHWYSIPQMLVIKEFRVPIEDYIWELPAGLVDGDEDIVETAKRELLEETGYEVTKVIGTSPFVFNSPGLTNESVAYVFVEAKKSIDAKPEMSEEIEHVLLNREQMKNLINRANATLNFNIGAKAWLIFNIFQRTGHIKSILTNI